MNILPLLVEVRNCLCPSFIAISTVYNRTSYLGEFVDGGAVMFKNITWASVAAGCARACVLPARESMAEPLCSKT